MGEPARVDRKYSEVVPSFVPVGLAEAKHVVDGLEQQLKAAYCAVDELLRQTRVECTSQVATGRGCGASFPIGQLTFIQTHWYTEPHGCAGGDYWNAGEGQFDCPACGKRNRLYATPEIQALKAYFREVKDVYERS